MPGENGEGGSNINIERFFENILQHPLAQLADIFFSHKTHFHIQLGKFRLAVGTQIFIAEAACQLEISVGSGYHQNLLEELGALRQGIKAAGVYSGGHQIIAGALWGALAENGRFNFVKAFIIKKMTHGYGYFMTQPQSVLHFRAA